MIYLIDLVYTILNMKKTMFFMPFWNIAFQLVNIFLSKNIYFERNKRFDQFDLTLCTFTFTLFHTNLLGRQEPTLFIWCFGNTFSQIGKVFGGVIL